MLSHLIVLLDKAATSYCIYQNPVYDAGDSEFMPLMVLNKVIEYAQEHSLALTFVLGNQPLPPTLEKTIRSVEHTKIVPSTLKTYYPEAAIVINSYECSDSLTIKGERHNNVILRLTKGNLKDLASYIEELAENSLRLNLCLLEIDHYTQQDLNEYQNQLEKLTPFIVKLYKKGCLTELNFISDRMLLQEMNNCEAGLKHLTVSADGCFFICPAFSYEKPTEPIGNIEQGFVIKNKQLLEIDHAPICRNCDAYQCKRCLYLNQKITLEINTPSQQQCVISHLERKTSGIVLESLRYLDRFRGLHPITELDYLDPFEVVKDPKKMLERNQARLFPQNTIDHSQDADGSKLNKEAWNIETIGNLLLEIQQGQREILRRLGSS